MAVVCTNIAWSRRVPAAPQDRKQSTNGPAAGIRWSYMNENENELARHKTKYPIFVVLHAQNIWGQTRAPSKATGATTVLARSQDPVGYRSQLTQIKNDRQRLFEKVPFFRKGATFIRRPAYLQKNIIVFQPSSHVHAMLEKKQPQPTASSSSKGMMQQGREAKRYRWIRLVAMGDSELGGTRETGSSQESSPFPRHTFRSVLELARRKRRLFCSSTGLRLSHLYRQVVPN